MDDNSAKVDIEFNSIGAESYIMETMLHNVAIFS
jgi:hypothetical protein